ncbi:MAG: lipocalin-like domain-containing protein [Actinomycetota bacterium]
MSNLVGTWELVEWTATVGGRESRPFGGNVVGRLTYTPDGYMWAALMRRDRPSLTAGSMAGATATERAAAAAGYLNYGGTFTSNDDQVVHHVEVSLFPNWVGLDQVRKISWIGEELELSTGPETSRSGETVVNRLRWRRLL